MVSVQYVPLGTQHKSVWRAAVLCIMCNCMAVVTLLHLWCGDHYHHPYVTSLETSDLHPGLLLEAIV